MIFWDEYFMLQAELAKLRSNCVTRQVGAVIVRNHKQCATLFDICRCNHAFTYAIMHCAKKGRCFRGISTLKK